MKIKLVAIFLVFLWILLQRKQHINRVYAWSGRPKVRGENHINEDGQPGVSGAMCPADYLSQKLLTRNYLYDNEQVDDFQRWLTHAEWNNDFARIDHKDAILKPFKNLGCEAKYLLWHPFNDVRMNDTFASYQLRSGRPTERYRSYSKECNNNCVYDPTTHQKLLERLKNNETFNDTKQFMPETSAFYKTLPTGPLSAKEQREYLKHLQPMY